MTNIPEDLRGQYDAILLTAADNGGEYECDEDERAAKFIERIAKLTLRVQELELEVARQYQTIHPEEERGDL